MAAIPNVNRADLRKIADRMNDKTFKTITTFLDAGKSCAVYCNQAFDSGNCGHKFFMSYGLDPSAQLNTLWPPDQMPHFKGARTPRAYRLVAVCAAKSEHMPPKEPSGADA